MRFKTGKAGAKVLNMMMAALIAGSMCVSLQTIAPDQAYAASKAKVTLSVKAAPDGKLVLNKGKKIKLKVLATKGAKVTYKSSNAKVASVSSKGQVSAKKAGKATIIVKAIKSGNAVKKKVAVTVKDSAAIKLAAQKKAQEEAAVVNTQETVAADAQVESVSGKATEGVAAKVITVAAVSQVESKDGFVTEGGKTYYYRNNAKVYGLFSVGSAKYYTNTSTGVLVTGWQRLSDGDRYFNPKDGGKMVIGRFQVPHSGGSNWYYFDANGVRQANVLKDGYFYRAGDGVMVASCWQRFSVGDRYFKADGKMAIGCFQVPHSGGSNWYYFDANGVRQAGLAAGGYYFRPSDGVGMKIASINAGTYEILSALGGDQRLDVSAGSTANMANVQTYANTSTNAQVWKVESVGGSYYKITNVNSGKALDVQGGSTANGANVFQYTANGTDAQKWMPVSCGAGVVLINKASGKALDIAGGICGNCANVQSFDVNCTNAQIWIFKAQAKYNPSFSGKVYGTDDEQETAISIWNAYTAFRAQKNVPQVRWSDYCAKLAYDTCVAESRIGSMQHGIAIPVSQRLTYSDILQYSTWRKAGASAVDRWYKSEGHHRQMRNNNGTTEAGVGVYYDGSKWWYAIVYNFSGNNQYQGTLW